MIKEESWQKIKDGDIWFDMKSKDNLNGIIKESQHFLLKDMCNNWKYPCNFLMTLIPEIDIPDEYGFSHREGRIQLEFTEKSALRLFNELRKCLNDLEFNRKNAKEREEQFDKRQLEKETKVVTFADMEIKN